MLAMMSMADSSSEPCVVPMSLRPAGMAMSASVNSASATFTGAFQTVAEVKTPSVYVRVRWDLQTAFVSVGEGSILLHEGGVCVSLPVPPAGVGREPIDSSASCQMESVSVVTTSALRTVIVPWTHAPTLLEPVCRRGAVAGGGGPDAVGQRGVGGDLWGRDEARGVDGSATGHDLELVGDFVVLPTGRRDSYL